MRLSAMKPHMVTEYEIRDKMGNVKRTYPGSNPKPTPDKLIINVLTQNGIIKRHIEQPFQSFLANFTRLINYGWMQIGNDTGASANDIILTHATGGATKLTDDAYHCKVNEAALAPAAPNVYGIMVGDMDNNTGLGLTVESGIGNELHYGDYMLKTLLLNDGGSPNTDLEHRITNLSMPDDDTLVISRRFQNDSAADIYVDECGMVGTEDDNNEEFMITRDILGSTLDPPYITVATTEILEISYTFRVSAIGIAAVGGGLVSNWLKYLSSILGFAVPVSAMKDIVNSAQATADPSGAQTDQDMTAAQDDDTHGIVIGGWLSDNSYEPPNPPFATDNYKVSSKLLDSEIDYGPMVAIAIDLETTYTQFGMYRDFENDNLTTVYVQDSGLYMKDATLTKYFMMARSLVTTDPAYITILPDEILRVKKYMKFNL